MVGSDVEQHSDVRLEIVHIVELEAAQLHHVHEVRLARHLPREAAAYVSGQPGVDAGADKYVVYEHRGGGFAVAAGDAHHLGIGVPARELYLADNGYMLREHSRHNGNIDGYARAFHHLVGGKYARHGVGTFLELYPFGLKHRAVAGRYMPRIAQKHIEAFILGKYGGTGAALARTEHNKTSFHIFHCHYRIFSVTKVSAASMMPIIQKRVTILDSGIALSGRCMRASIPAFPSFWK
ncbi:hypothetical protein IMSAGC008_02299 [Muribaculaceae bacterium]|nr:hypothetical protein IMSAGC008_02299 [Muribaculaceae bacterium]